MFDIETVRRDFPIIDNCVYVNHAAVSPIPLSVQKGMVEQTNLHLFQQNDLSDLYFEKYQYGRTLAAKLVNSDSNLIAYINNTSHGISLIANGLDLKAGDNVIVPSVEFPSNYLVWKNMASAGVELRLAEPIDDKITIESIRPLIDENTKVVTLSQVQFYNGYKVDLAPIGALCQKHGALFIVDGTQSTGAITIDVKNDAVDALVVSAHKWMLGPLGIGFMALSQRALDRISVKSMGWLSVNDPFLFKREVDLLPSARRFEPGTENSVGRFGLIARMEQIHAVGAVQIEQRLISLTDKLCEKLSEKGYIITSPRETNHKSGIVTFVHPSHSNESLFEKLSQANIRLSLRSSGIRVSPHYYNSEDEIEFIINQLP